MTFPVSSPIPGHSPVLPTASRFPAARFGAPARLQDTFTPRFGNQNHEDDPRLQAFLDALSRDVDTMIAAMEALDVAFYKALDEGDCDRAREIMAKKDKLEDKLAADGDDLDISTDELVANAMAAYDEHRRQSERDDMAWDSLLLETGLLEPDPAAALADEAPTSLREERRALSMRLITLSEEVDQAVMNGNDAEALIRYDELKRLREERRALGNDD